MPSRMHNLVRLRRCNKSSTHWAVRHGIWRKFECAPTSRLDSAVTPTSLQALHLVGTLATDGCEPLNPSFIMLSLWLHTSIEYRPSTFQFNCQNRIIDYCRSITSSCSEINQPALLCSLLSCSALAFTWLRDYEYQSLFVQSSGYFAMNIYHSF